MGAVNNARTILRLLHHECRALAGGFLAQLSGSTEIQFTNIYRFGTWCFRGLDVPQSGPGARLEETVRVRQVLSQILRDYGIANMLDAACGDMTWMPLVIGKHPEVRYTGVDVVKELVEKNRRKHPQLRFYHGDLTEHVPERYDLIHSRETLNHLKTANVIRVLENFRRSGSRYLLTNNLPSMKRNIDIIAQNGMYRGINWRLPPYNLEPTGEWRQDSRRRTYVLIPLDP